MVGMSDHPEVEERLRRVNLVLRAVRSVNQLIVREKDREKLISDVCRILVETRSYYNAWVVLLDATGNFLLAAEAGLSSSFRPMLRHLQAGKLPRCNQEALAQASVVVTVDPVATCADCPLATAYGGRGGIAARLEHESEVYGLLCASIPADLVTDHEELSLFQDIAHDIGFALHSLRAEEERTQAEDAVKESESRYRALFENAGEAIFVCSADGTITSVNKTCETLTGHTSDHLSGMSIHDLVVSEEREIVDGLISLRIDGRRTDESEEFSLVKSDGTKACVRLTVTPVLDIDQPGAVQVIASDVTEEKRLRENMQYYITQITRAQEDERLRISRELHDDTVQTLAGLSRDIGSVVSKNRELPESVRQRLLELRGVTDSALEGVRRYSQDLRPSIMDDLGLVPALEWLSASLTEEHGIRSRIKVAGERYRLSAEHELSVFRIVQEALNNVRQHSRATEVETVIDFGEDALTVMTTDNGMGFRMPDRAGDLVASGRLGIVGMRERARLVGGTLIAQSEVGKGTTVTLRVPRVTESEPSLQNPE